MKKKIKASIVIPLCLLVYLAFMGWMGRDSLKNDATVYWIKMGVGFLIIVGLYFALRHKEKLRSRREQDEATYGHYGDEEP